MSFILVLLLWLPNYSSAQDSNCDYFQNVAVGSIYYIYNSNYPNNYTAGQACRWIAFCPQGYNCRLVCELRLPQSTSCSLDRLLFSLTGDPTLSGKVQTYCGSGSLNVTSTGQKISLGLLANQNSPGGSFNCTLMAQNATRAQ